MVNTLQVSFKRVLHMARWRLWLGAQIYPLFIMHYK